MQATQDTLVLTPPQPPGMLRALLLALVAHALLVAALTWGVHWKQTESTAVEAEIWSSVTQQAAPREAVVTPPTPPTPVPPPPVPQPKVEPPPPPPPPVVKVTPPPPAPVVRDADIALEREKKKRELEKQRQEEAQEKLEKQQEEKRELAKKAAADKKKQDQKARELEAQREAQAEAVEAKKKAEAAQAQAQAQAQKAQQQKAAEAAMRAENLKRMQGLAGASGAADATGTALKSSGPSSSYAGRVSARVKPNIVFPDDIAGNPTADVEVRSSPDGTIVSSRLVKSSGVKSWDDAVLKALEKTGTLPRDTDGRVPSPLIIGFSPKS